VNVEEVADIWAKELTREYLLSPLSATEVPSSEARSFIADRTNRGRFLKHITRHKLRSGPNSESSFSSPSFIAPTGQDLSSILLAWDTRPSTFPGNRITNGVIRRRSQLPVRQSEMLLGLEWDQAEIREVTG
jgi:hypothetical protein